MSAKTMPPPVENLEERFQRVLEAWQRATELPGTLPTKAAEEEQPLHEPGDRQTRLARRQAWNEIIDKPLIEWGHEAKDFEEEGIPPPSRETLSLAGRLAAAMRDAGLSPPTRVVPDTHGGIVFEHRRDEVFETIRISSDRSIDVCHFVCGRLAHRVSI